MAASGALALCLADEYAKGPREAFIDGPEFCHLHAAPEGSIHLTLPQRLGEQAIEMGWAEQHPVVGTGSITDCLLLVYAPRDDTELETVVNLIAMSRSFAQGRYTA